MRRDGNCFYRSYLFQIFEHYALALGGVDDGLTLGENLDQIKSSYQALLETIKASKSDLTKEGGYDEIVIEDFYDVFLENVEKLAKLPEKFEVARKAGYKNPYHAFVVE